MLSSIISFVAGVLIGLVVNYLSEPFNELVAKSLGFLGFLLNPDRFDLNGKWVQTFREPGGKVEEPWETIHEDVKLIHRGRTVNGVGTTRDNHRRFVYRCQVRHNMLFGSYVKEGEKGNIAGTGMIQLIVSPDRTKMRGQATWFDHDTEKIESSSSEWEKA